MTKYSRRHPTKLKLFYCPSAAGGGFEWPWVQIHSPLVGKWDSAAACEFATPGQDGAVVGLMQPDWEERLRVKLSKMPESCE
jgi:hypothetical protein